MPKYQVVEVGALSEWGDYFGGFSPETSLFGRRVLEKELALDFLGITVNSRLPGEGADFWHAHSILEELYLFLEGEGVMALDDDVVPVKAGTAIRVGQGVMRSWHTNADSPTALKWVCIRAGGDRLADIPGDAQPDRTLPLPW
jgi:uncharacterized cupin superfamily protein